MCESTEETKAIPSFCIKEGFIDKTGVNMYYTNGNHTSQSDWSPAESNNFDICNDLLLLQAFMSNLAAASRSVSSSKHVKDFLIFEY